MTDFVLQLRNLRTVLGGSGGILQNKRRSVDAVDDVSLDIVRGEMFGIVGESGSGKSTLGKTILGIQAETAGEILLNGETVSGLAPRAARVARRGIQYVYQDAGASLDPWWTIGATLRETLAISGGAERAEQEKRIAEIFDAFGLAPEIMRRYPHQLSGGQLKRISLARALILRPEVIILDEPTAGLDLTVQAAVLKLVHQRHEATGVTIILITHDLSVVRSLCDRVAIMRLGKIVEVGETAQIFAAPHAEYTKALLDAVPRLSPAEAKV
jgi:ABC-type glutathione transport system ATPase component